MNRLWTIESKPDELVKYFHKNMVAVSPSDRLRITGQEACVNAWKAFSQMAKIQSWKELEPKIDLYGEDNFAIVTYYYEITCEIGGQSMNLQGRDMLSLIFEDGKWLIIADHFSPYPQQSSS
jgi:ketosteroid isomerase-like protein